MTFCSSAKSDIIYIYVYIYSITFSSVTLCISTTVAAQLDSYGHFRDFLGLWG